MKALRKFTAFLSLLALLFSSGAFAAYHSEGPNKKVVSDELSSEFRKKIEQVQDAAAGKKANAELDTYRLLDQDVFPINGSKFTDGVENTVKNEVIDIANSVIDDLLLKEDFLTDDSKIVNLKSIKPILNNDGGFDIWAGDKKLYTFRGKITDVILRDNMISFIDDLGYSSKKGSQMVYFVDLKQFQTVLGNGPLPVFKIPFSTKKGKIKSFNHKSTKIAMQNASGTNVLKASPKQLRVITDPQMISYNLTASLLDADTYKSGANLSKSFTDNFFAYSDLALKEKMIKMKLEKEQQDLITNFNSTMKIKIQEISKNKTTKTKAYPDSKSKKELSDKVEKLAYELDYDDEEINEAMQKEAKNKADEVIEKITDKEKIASRMNVSLELKAQEKRFFTRMQLLWNKLTLPTENSSSKIRDALLTMNHIFTSKDLVLKKRYLQEGLGQLINNRFIRNGFALAAGTFISTGLIFPAEMGQYLYSTLSIPAAITEQIFTIPTNKIAEVGYHGMISFSKTVGGVFRFSEAYLKPEMLKKLSVGLPVLFSFVATTIGLPHLIVNTKKLWNDMKVNHLKTKNSKGWVKAFIEREEASENAYKQTLLDAEVKKQEKLKNIVFSAEEEKQIKAVMEKELEASRNSITGKTLGLFQSIFHFATLNKFNKEKTLAEESKKIDTFGKALRHFLFSFASFTNSGAAYVHIWNGWFFFRSFVTYPKLALGMLYFPNLYHTVAEKGLSPTKFNGAKLNRLDMRKIKKFKKSLGVETLKSIEGIEEKLLNDEIEIQEKVAKKAFTKLTEVISSKKDYTTMSKKGFNIKSIGDKNNLAMLSENAREFYYSYYDLLLDQALSDYYSDYTGQKVTPGFKRSDKSLLNKIKIDTQTHLFGDEIGDQKELVTKTKIASILDNLDEDRKLVKIAKERAAQKWKNKVKAYAGLKNSNVTQKLSKKYNGQVRRFQLVRSKIKDPAAMARAVRSMIVGNIIDKPMELAFLFLFLAGVQVTPGEAFDLYRPIQDTMFGPNSIFYLSKETFGIGFAYGMISSVLADTWMKLQMDAMNEKNFGRPIPKRFRNKSFFNFFKYNAFGNPKNSWWRNQKYFVEIIWSNLRAASITMITIGLLFRGRFDVDSFIVGYGFSFLTPISGITQKIEQTFELTADWYRRNYTRKMAAHADVQKHVNVLATKGKAIYNVFYKTYENILGYYLGFFENGGNNATGPRAIARILFADLTPTEWITLSMENIKASKIGKIPGVKQSCNGLLRLVTKNYIGWKHIKPPDL